MTRITWYEHLNLSGASPVQHMWEPSYIRLPQPTWLTGLPGWLFEANFLESGIFWRQLPSKKDLAFFWLFFCVVECERCHIYYVLLIWKVLFYSIREHKIDMELTNTNLHLQHLCKTLQHVIGPYFISTPLARGPSQPTAESQLLTTAARHYPPRRSHT